MPHHPLVGKYNHRDIFAEIFPEVPLDLQGFVQQMLATEKDRFLLLNTV